jgi:hypothetical protein
MKKLNYIVLITLLILLFGISIVSNPIYHENKNYPLEYNNPSENLSLIEYNAKYENESYIINGKIKNNIAKEYDYIQIVFNLYNKDNKIIGTAVSNLNNIDSYEKLTFKIENNINNIERCELKEITGF